MTNKEINERIANFIGYKKVKNVKTIIGKDIYITEQIWVHKFNPLQDDQMIYNDNYPQKELVKSDDILENLDFENNTTELVNVYDECKRIVSNFIDDKNLVDYFWEGTKILDTIIDKMFNTETLFKTLGIFLEWYDNNKNKFVYMTNNT